MGGSFVVFIRLMIFFDILKYIVLKKASRNGIFSIYTSDAARPGNYFQPVDLSVEFERNEFKSVRRKNYSVN